MYQTGNTSQVVAALPLVQGDEHRGATSAEEAVKRICVPLWKSPRILKSRKGIPHSAIWCILHKWRIKPDCFSQSQSFLETVIAKWPKFCCRFQGHRGVEITASNEPHFYLRGKINHLLHRGGTENQHFMIELERISLNANVFMPYRYMGSSSACFWERSL